MADMRLLLGDRCYRNARFIYQSVKTAAQVGIPKALPVYEQMKSRFATVSANLNHSKQASKTEVPKNNLDSPESQIAMDNTNPNEAT